MTQEAPSFPPTTPESASPHEDAWRRAHRELLRIAGARAQLDLDEGRWLLVAAREGTHARLGYASFVEYVEQLFGYSPRFTLERLRVAEALEVLPETARAVHDGAVSWSAARELTRVAVAETEGEWLAAATGKSARDIERMVSGHPPGSRPNDSPDAAFRRHLIRLEVSGETLAVFREAMAKLRRDAGAPLDNDTAVMMLARHVLGGPIDEGRASYQVAMSVCMRCGRGFQSGRGAVVEVDQDAVAVASCDAQRLHTVDNSTHVGADVPAPAVGTGVPDAPSASAADVNEGMQNASTGAGTKAQQGGRPRRPRTSQSIPPAVRRGVLLRDERRCRVPGCRNAVFLDVHHVESRGEGGRHDAANLVTLCAAHHRAVHRGLIRIRHGVEGKLVFEHADGSLYGRAGVSARLIDVRASAFRALRTLGFRETESRLALDRAIDVGGVHATTETLVRLALRELSSAA